MKYEVAIIMEPGLKPEVVVVDEGEREVGVQSLYTVWPWRAQNIVTKIQKSINKDFTANSQPPLCTATLSKWHVLRLSEPSSMHFC